METRRCLAILTAAIGSASCHGHGGAPTGYVVARQIVDPADLIGGPRAEGRVGDFLLANDHVRAIVSKAGDAVGFDPFGGALLDADVVRPAGEPGQDRLGEIFPSINVVTVSDVTTVDVAADGSDRHRAAIRVEGHGFAFPLIGTIPGLTDPVQVDLETDYSLGPDDASVLVETTVTSTATTKQSMLAYDVLLLGAGLDLFGSPRGAVDTGTFDWYGGDADGQVAYAWIPLDEPTMQIPFSDANQQIATMPLITLAPGQSKTFRRRLAIAAPDLGALGAEIARVRGRRTGTIAGTVTDSLGVAVDGAQLTITAHGVDSDGDGHDDVISRARSGADGSFTAIVPGGSYDVAVAGASSQLLAVHDGQTPSAAFQVPATGAIVFSASDAATGGGIPAKLTVVDGASNIAGRALASATSPGRVDLPAGDYVAWISHGPEWSRVQIPVTVVAGSNEIVTASRAELSRVVDTSGWLAMDDHLHMVHSRDSGLDLNERVLSLAAQGLEWVAATDHDRATDDGPGIAVLGSAAGIAATVGDEVSLPLYGHFNAWPMPDGDATSRADDGARLWFDVPSHQRLDAASVVAKLRALAGDRIVQMNHPRRSGMGYLATIGFDPTTGASTDPLATDFDTIEVNSDTAPASGNVMLDWMALTNLGHRMTAVGVSDSHLLYNAGYPRTLVETGDDDPTQVGAPSMLAAIRAGRASVSSGVFVTMTATTGGGIAAIGDTLPALSGAPVTIHVHAEAPDWCPFDSLVVYENGVPVSTQSITPALTAGAWIADVDVPVTPVADASYVAVVTGTASTFPEGNAIFGYTNPIYVDRAPAGWTPPGL